MSEIRIPAAALEAGARAAARNVEERHGSAEGRRLLGFDSADDFIEACWPNYLDQTRAAFLAMLEAWEGMQHDNYVIVLPLYAAGGQR